VETRTSPPLRTLLAVWKLTPARAATSLIDTYRRRAIASFRRVSALLGHAARSRCSGTAQAAAQSRSAGASHPL